MLFAAQFLSKERFEQALKDGNKIFLYNEIGFIPEERKGIEFRNCTIDRVESTWFTWNENSKEIVNFLKLHPNSMKLGNYDFYLAYSKAFFWSNMRIGYLHFCRKKYYNEILVYNVEPLHSKNRIKCFYRLVQNFLRPGINFPKIEKQIFKQRKTGIFICEETQVQLYENIIKSTSKSDRYIIFITDEKFRSRLSDFGYPPHKIILLVRKFQKTKVNLNISNLNLSSPFILEKVIAFREEIDYWFSISIQILNSGIESLLFNEGENSTYGAVFSEVMNKNQILTFNTMNGMKSGQAQDANINFNFWFVWDIKMKELLVEKCILNPNILKVTGHLMEDNIRSYRFKNSINVDLEALIGKKVISIFSVRGSREEKLETIKYIYNILKESNDIFVLLRPHPLEKENEWILPEFNAKNFKLITYERDMEKLTLYDQLKISDLSIVFGSTVALESKWFGVPCITIEKRKKSLIYCIDNSMIFHLNSLSENKEIFFRLLNSKSEFLNDDNQFVSDKILKIIDSESNNNC